MDKVNISRLGRANRTTKELGIKSGFHLTNNVKSAWRINDAEYDYINSRATDGEMLLILNDETTATFSEAKAAILLVEKLLKEYNEK